MNVLGKYVGEERRKLFRPAKWDDLSEEDRNQHVEEYRNRSQEMGDGNGNTVIPMTPKALVALIVGLLMAVGGGGSYVTGFLHEDAPNKARVDANSRALSEQGTQIQLLQRDVKVATEKIDDLKEQSKENNRLLIRLLRGKTGDDR